MHKQVLIVVLACAFVAGHAMGQQAFKGRIVYSVTYVDLPDDMQGLQTSLPVRAVFTTDGSSWRWSQESLLNGEHLLIYDSEKDSTYRVMTLAGRRVVVAEPGSGSPAFHHPKAANQTRMLMDRSATRFTVSDPANQPREAWCDAKWLGIPKSPVPATPHLALEFEWVVDGILCRYKMVGYEAFPVDQTYFTAPGNASALSPRFFHAMLR